MRATRRFIYGDKRVCRVASDRSKASRNTPLAAPLAGGRRGRERASDGSLSRLLWMRDRRWAGGLPRVSLAPMLCSAESRVRCLIAGPRVPACRCRAELQHTRTRASCKIRFRHPSSKKKDGLHPPASGLRRSHPLRCPLSSPTPAISFHPRLHLASFLRMDENSGKKRERTFWATETVV